MQQIITACAFIYRETTSGTQVLLVRRSKDSKFLPEVFEFPGGHVEPGENILDGLHRELNEELGIDGRIGEPFFVFTYNRQDEDTQTIEVIYFATILGDSHIKLSDEHSEYLWVNKQNLHNITIGKDNNDPELKAIQLGFSKLSTL